MPVLYTIDPSLNLLYYVAIGECSGAQFIQAAYNSAEDPLRGPNMLIIFDLLSMTDLDFNLSTFPEGIIYLRQWHSSGNSAEKTAILSHNRSAHGLLSTFELMASGLATHWNIFSDLPSALSWLDLAASTPQVRKIQSTFIPTASSTP